MSARTVADVLDQAADYLALPGNWGKGWFITETGCRCALGAIAWAVDPSDKDADPKYLPDAQQAAVVFAEYLADELGAARCITGNDEDQPYELDANDTVGGWNDEQTSPEPVVAALRACAARQLAGAR